LKFPTESSGAPSEFLLGVKCKAAEVGGAGFHVFFHSRIEEKVTSWYLLAELPKTA